MATPHSAFSRTRLKMYEKIENPHSTIDILDRQLVGNSSTHQCRMSYQVDTRLEVLLFGL